ncbi:hypothetical protein R6Q57_006058 [Mikania cordata]
MIWKLLICICNQNINLDLKVIISDIQCSVIYVYTLMQKYLFLMYLHLMGHPKAMEIKSSQIEKLKISWAKTKNFVNCGIFVMRRMEMFYGQSYEGLGLWVSKRRKS